MALELISSLHEFGNSGNAYRSDKVFVETVRTDRVRQRCNKIRPSCDNKGEGKVLKSQENNSK